MRDEDKSKEQLISELVLMRKHTIQVEKDLAKQNLMAKSLLDSEERLRAFLDNSPAIAWMKNEHGRHVYLSKTYENRFGVRLEDWLGKSDFELWPQKIAEEFWRNDQAVLTSGKTMDVIEEAPNPDGEGCYWWNFKFPFIDGAGKKYVGGVGIDITEHKIIAETLRASEEKYRSIFDNAPIGIFRTSVDGRLLDANRELARMLDYASPQELITTANRTSVAEALYANPEERLKLVVDKALAGKGAWDEAEIRLRRKDGKPITVRLFFRVIPGKMDESATLEGFAEDISERRQAEHALRSSEIKYRIVAEHTYDWEYWVSPEGRYLYSSPSCERITGFRAVEFEDHPELLSRIIHPDDMSQYEAHLEQCQTSGTKCELEFRIIHRNGATRWMGHVYQQVFDDKGQYLGRRGSNRDITERKQAEVALQKAYDEIEQQVKERTAELADANEALRNAYQELQDVIEFLPDATFVVDLKRKVVAWNHAMQEMTGVAKKDMLGRGEYAAAFYGEARPIMIDLVMGDATQAEDMRYTVLERKGKTIFGEAFVPMTLKGKAAYVWATAAPLFDLQGELIGAIESVRDITNLKRAEDQISKINSLKQLLLGTSSLGEKLKSITDGAVEIFGADFARIWLIREGDLCAEGCFHATDSESPHCCRDRARCLHLVTSSGRCTSIEESHRRVPLGCCEIGLLASDEDPLFITNDATRDLHVNNCEWAKSLGLTAFAGYRLLAADGKPMGTMAFFRKERIQPDEEKLMQNLADTTSQVIIAGMAEEALRESETKFRALFDHSPMGISIAQMGVTLLYNEAGLRIFGYDDCSQVIGTSPLSRIAPHCRNEISKYIKRRERGEAVPGTYETEGIRRDGSVFHLFIQAAGIQWNGQPATVSFFRDITQRKVAEKELINYRDHLEELVKERTRELSRANEQLSRLIEERWRTGQELKEREEFVSAIVENIPDMIFVKDAQELRFVRLNRAGEDLLGYSRADLIGKSDYDFFPTTEADFFKAKDLEVLRNRQLLDIAEETIQTKSLGERILHTKKIPILNSEGIPLYLLGISEDITARKRVEEALKASEQRYRQLLSSVTDYIFTIEIRNGLPVSTSHGPGCIAVTGYAPEDYVRTPSLWYEMVHPEDQQIVIDHAETAIRGEAQNPLEHRIIHKDGTIRWVRNTIVPHYDSEGKVVMCDGLVSDITERKIVEHELKQTNTSLENIIENSPDAIGIVDESGRFIRWNRMAAEVCGYTFEELKGKSAFDLYADKDELQRMLVQLRREGSVNKWEMRFLRKEGDIIILEISIGLLKSSQNKTLGSVCVARDLSGIKETLAIIKASNEQLSQEIAERKRAEGALLKSEENLRSLTSQLFTIQEKERNRISKELHDGLGQDLTVLKIYLTSIQNKLKEDQGALRDDCGFLLNRIDHSVADMRRLCHDLSPYLLEELGLAASLKHLVEKVCQKNSLCSQLDLQDISTYFPRRTLAAVYRIFQEALTNIVKHSGATHVSVSIKKQDKEVNFSVIDNGRGFDTREVARRPISKKGMGLFAMEERAFMLGGTFEILSIVGQGTTVTFSLPVKEREKP